MCERDGNEVAFAFDRLLLALGRQANVEGFGLEELGVTLSERGTVGVDALIKAVPEMTQVAHVRGEQELIGDRAPRVERPGASSPATAGVDGSSRNDL